MLRIYIQPHAHLVPILQYSQSAEMDEYIQNLILNPMVNWDMFLGVLLNNRVNGVVYNKLTKFKEIPKYIEYYLKTIYPFLFSL